MDEDQKAAAEEIRSKIVHNEITYLKRISDDMTAMRKSFDELFKYIHKAESLIPEEFRRLCMTYHDVHDIRNGYVELGLEVPVYLDRVVELVSDKFKHAVADLEAEGGHFYKARKAVVARGDYRYDHSIPLLAADKQKEHEDETGSSKS